MLNLKNKFKEVVGSDYVAPGGAPAAVPAPKKKEAAPAPEATKKTTKKEEPAPQKTSAVPQVAQQSKEEVLDLSGRILYTGSNCDADDILRCVLVGELCKKPLKVVQQAPTSVAVRIPFYPAVVVASTSSSGQNKQGTVIFGAAAVCRFLAMDCTAVAVSGADAATQDMYLDIMETTNWAGDASTGKKMTCCDTLCYIFVVAQGR